MARAFLSHSSADGPFVRFLRNDLVAAGVDVYLDDEEKRVGNSIVLDISDAIEACDVFLLCVSSSANASRWVRKEMAIAVTRAINGLPIAVIPIRLDSSEIPLPTTDQLCSDFTKAGAYDKEFVSLLRRIAPTILPLPTCATHCLSLDETRLDRLVALSRVSTYRDWTLDYLIETLPARARHTERYGTYLALASIGGDRARAVVEAGLSEPDMFPRLGAQRAWAQLSG